MTWHQWIGLPHEFRADPNNGVAADCLLMVWSLLAEAGVDCPPLDELWFELAEKGEYKRLVSLFRENTIAVDEPEEHALTLFVAERSIGIGVVADGGLLYIHHARGVQWTPLEFCKKLRYRKFR